MSLVIKAPSAAPDDTLIRSGTFWPAVDPTDARSTQRIDMAIPAERLRAALIEAIATVNGELAAWRALREAEGHTTLAAVPAGKIDNASVNAHRYLRAVGCLAKASLMERTRDVDTTGDGQRQADTLNPTIDDLRRDARWAISDIQGLGRTTVELI